MSEKKEKKHICIFVECPHKKRQPCNHLWAVRDRVEPYTLRTSSKKYNSAAYLLGLTIYFCQYCLETKKVEDEREDL